MRDLATLIREYPGVFAVRDIGKAEPRTIVKEIIKADNEGATLVFTYGRREIPSVSGVLNTRKKLFFAMGARNEEDAYRKLLSASPGKVIEEGFEEHFSETDVRPEELPAIKFFKRDGGRYLTSSIIITRAGDGYNASIHRMMLIEGRGFAVRVVQRHLYRSYEESISRGEDLPVAVVIGADPVSLLLAAYSSPPYGVFELSLAQSITGEPLRVARTPLYDLPIPATAYTVMEGILTRELVDEGPFVDLLWLYDRVRKQPLFIPKRIYVNKAGGLFHVILPGGREHKVLMGFPREAAIWDAVRRAVAKVVKVRLTDASGNWLHAVISIEKVHDGDAKTAIAAAFAAHPSLKHVIVVDHDIDPDIPGQVEWAIATRFQAGRGLVIIPAARGSTLDPSSEDGLTYKVGVDATVPIKDREKYIAPEPEGG